MEFEVGIMPPSWRIAFPHIFVMSANIPGGFRFIRTYGRPIQTTWGWGGLFCYIK